jgi:ammonium transporter, Amt family
MKLIRKIAALALAAVVAMGVGTTTSLADDPPPRAATPEDRLYDLEQYFKNGLAGEKKVAKKDDKGVEVKNEKGETEMVTDKWQSNIKGPGPGHTAWQMTSTALVLFMTLPGLALFYGGLVRKKNVLSILMQCMGIAGLVTILWWACGYSLSFAGENPYIGDLSKALLKGISPGSSGEGWYWIPDAVWVMFQLTFAIITPALMLGAIAERMKFSAILMFVGLWMFVVYFPLAHMVWSIKGLLAGVANPDAPIKALDFAGGTVVHMSSGWSALILCIILGKRTGYPKEKMAPHSMVLCMVGTGMLWVGWYGFNAGSALGAEAIAATAFATTTLAAATGGFVWSLVEWMHRGKPSVLGMCSGIVAGLVVITPACGFVDYNGAMIIGVLAGIIPYFAVVFLKQKLGYDDALDTFGVHGVGGTLGAILTGVLAKKEVNPGAEAALNAGVMSAQFKAIAITMALSIVGTIVIAFIVKAVFGLRPTVEEETAGLDITDHGEEGYIL